VVGVQPTHSGEHFAEWNDFSLAQAAPEHPATPRLHIGFIAPSREHVDEFWRVGTEADYRDDGAPGPRPQYSDDYYGASGSEPQGRTANVHLAFPADDDATVDAFHAAALEAGYRDNGAPGERPVYHPGYYSAYVLDPDGNNVEVVHHNR
jgi:catechol 2,3-dioxygenase-like lactoylglutathione lyase family enzyme